LAKFESEREVSSIIKSALWVQFRLIQFLNCEKRRNM